MGWPPGSTQQQGASSSSPSTDEPPVPVTVEEYLSGQEPGGDDGEVIDYDKDGSGAWRKQKVRIQGKDFILCEATADGAKQWRKLHIRETRMKDGEVIGVGGDVAESEILLISLCLKTRSGGIVQRNWVGQLPNRITKDLFQRAKKMSDLEEPEDEAALEKRLSEIQKKLAKLRKKSANGKPDAGEGTEEGADSSNPLGQETTPTTASSS
jgi:hypothetical protein